MATITNVSKILRVFFEESYIAIGTYCLMQHLIKVDILGKIMYVKL